MKADLAVLGLPLAVSGSLALSLGRSMLETGRRCLLGFGGRGTLTVNAFGISLATVDERWRMELEESSRLLLVLLLVVCLLRTSCTVRRSTGWTCLEEIDGELELNNTLTIDGVSGWTDAWTDIA